MKYLHTFIFIFFFFSTLHAQQKTVQISNNIKITGETLKCIIPVKHKGALFEIYDDKTYTYNLEFYDLNMDKKWTYTFSREDLGNPSKWIISGVQYQLYYLNNRFIFIAPGIKSKVINEDAIQVRGLQNYTIYSIGLDGKLINKLETPNIEVLNSAVVSDNNLIFYCSNNEKNDKQLGDIQILNTDPLSIGEKTELNFQPLKHLTWEYAGYAGGKIFLYCKYNSNGNEMARVNNSNWYLKGDTFDLDLISIQVSGKDFGKQTNFTLKVKLNNYYPGPEDDYGMQYVTDPVNFLIDSTTKAIYTYCHMTEKLSKNDANKCKGIYVQKYNLTGNQIWSKQYPNEEVAKINLEVGTKEPVSGLGQSYYESEMLIDDSTHSIILVRKEQSPNAAITIGGSKGGSKCYLFDENGNLKDAFMDLDQTDVRTAGMAQTHISPFYTSCAYKNSDFEYSKGLSTIFSKYSKPKEKPIAYLINLGDKYWAAIMDMEKDTLDIYEL